MKSSQSAPKRILINSLKKSTTGKESLNPSKNEPNFGFQSQFESSREK